jgi:hypothetical protein
MVIDSKLRPRWLLKKSFPPYAYLPGRQPHPVLIRQGTATVSGLQLLRRRRFDSAAFLWGLDLFKHGAQGTR